MDTQSGFSVVCGVSTSEEQSSEHSSLEKRVWEVLEVEGAGTLLLTGVGCVEDKSVILQDGSI